MLNLLWQNSECTLLLTWLQAQICSTGSLSEVHYSIYRSAEKCCSTHLCCTFVYQKVFHLTPPGNALLSPRTPGIFSEVPATAEKLSEDLCYEKREEFLSSESKTGLRRTLHYMGFETIPGTPLNLFFSPCLCRTFYCLSLWLLLLAAHTTGAQYN